MGGFSCQSTTFSMDFCATSSNSKQYNLQVFIFQFQSPSFNDVLVITKLEILFFLMMTSIMNL